jgi:Short C-terminal domain
MTWRDDEIVELRGTMSAQQRAANAAAEIHRSRAAAEAARGVTLTALGVRVKGNEVFNLNFLLRKELRYLGPLAGASAGVMDVKPASGGAVLSSIVIGNVPRVGTIFVAFANGKLHKKALLQGSPRQMRNVDTEVARFNAMADAAGSSEVKQAQPPRRAAPDLASPRPAERLAEVAGTQIRLSCGHGEFITDPRIARWLSVEGDISYHCRTCDTDQPIVAIGEDVTSEPGSPGGELDRAASSQLTDELERVASLHASGALTDAEFHAAKARLLGM